jgi:hypothetical protein
MIGQLVLWFILIMVLIKAVLLKHINNSINEIEIKIFAFYQ